MKRLLLLALIIVIFNSCVNSEQNSPVSIRINSYIYNRQIIFQEIEDKIGPYDHCGCDYPPSFGPKKEGYPELNYKMIMLLRDQVISANKN
jgi:hypothetical protein